MYLAADGKLAAVVEVNSETDFVAKNDEFIALAKGCAELVAAKDPVDVAALSALPMGDGTVESTRAALVGKIGVLVDVIGGGDTLAKDIAMHIAASKPKALDAAGVPADLLDTERRIAVEKAREAGKPENMLDKIAEGTVQKYLKDVTLLGQVFVKAEDGKQTIEQLLKSKGATVNGFTLYVVGEGIEKKVNDFAAEVAAQAAAAKKQ